jgi:tyrosinase
MAAPVDVLKQAGNAGIVKGLREVSGILPRVDIDIMIRDQPDVFNLFLLALEYIQRPDYKPSHMRYAEIAGTN